MTQKDDFRFSSDKMIQVELKEDGSAEASLSGEKVSGTWIPFYDQAFKVTLSIAVWDLKD